VTPIPAHAAATISRLSRIIDPPFPNNRAVVSLWEHTHLENIAHDKLNGSERECEEPMILRCFAENEEFGLERGQSLRGTSS
jgi:hypothetical protein